jgi:hypothetical protein
LLLVLIGVLVFKFGGHPGLCTFRFLISRYCIFCHIEDNASFKLGGVEKHTFFLFVFVYKKYIYRAMLLLSMSYTVTMVAFHGFV